MIPDQEGEAHVSLTVELTAAQLRFLHSLSQHPAAATHDVDASVVGPLIRANLVLWEDDAGAAARRRVTPGSTFSLTPEGAKALLDRGHSDSPPNPKPETGSQGTSS